LGAFCGWLFIAGRSLFGDAAFGRSLEDGGL
jgi:hypothetical protein